MPTYILRADIVLSFSGVTFVLFLLDCSSICMRPGSHTQLPNNTVCVLLFVWFCLILFFFRDVAFSSILVPLTYISLYGEYVVCFSLPGGVFLPCDHGLDFLKSAFLCDRVQLKKIKVVFWVGNQYRTLNLRNNSRTTTEQLRWDRLCLF